MPGGFGSPHSFTTICCGPTTWPIVPASEAHRRPDGHELLVARQAERLNLEAGLKAFVGTKGEVSLRDPISMVTRLIELDPVDPYARLACGDVCWMVGDDTGAIESYGEAATMGTLTGALAAHRAGQVCASIGRRDDSRMWWRLTRDLDPAFVVDEEPPRAG